MDDNKIVEWALKEKGCPVCRLALYYTGIYIRWFYRDYFNEYDTLEEFAEGGLCAPHAKELSECLRSEQLVRIFQYMLGHRLNYTKNLSAVNLKKKLINLKPGRKKYENCLFCKKFSEETDNGIEILKKMINEKGLDEVLGGTDGLCLVHMPLLADKLKKNEAARLISLQTEIIRKVYDSLQAYSKLELHEVRVREDAESIKKIQKEADKWPEALNYFPEKWPSIKEALDRIEEKY